MHAHSWRKSACTAFALSMLAFGGIHCGAQALSGAGSTFVNPAMSQWTVAYKAVKPGISIAYQSVGSGAGIEKYKAGEVDFAATDAPLTDAEIGQMPVPTLHVPVVAGAIVIAYNMPGFPDLRITGDIIADIYLGKITRWNDPRIEKENPNVKFPPISIAPAHRYDGSGTTYIFTDYLSAVSPDWKSGPGRGRTVKWPVGSALVGNEGVAERVFHTAGAIGYIELAYALPRNMHHFLLKNAAGNYVRASVESTEAGTNASLASMKKDVRVSTVNSNSRDAYPIIGFTYILVPKKSKNPQRGEALTDFLKWVLGPGQQMVGPLKYAPLSPAIASISLGTLNQASRR